MTLVPPFKVLASFEGGGLGQLLKCQDAKGKLFAAKLPKDFSTVCQQLILDEERRFWRHQGNFVVEYYGSINHQDGRRGFAMELMDGSLSGLIRGGSPIRRPVALSYFADAAQGIAEVHRSAIGSYHGDIKLANILHKSGSAKLADFGLARGGVGQTQMLGPHRGGTPGYFPPEGYSSPAGDVYSLGVSLWAMLSGREPPAQGPDVHLMLPPRLSALLNAMFDRDPGHRIRTDAVLQRLEAVKMAKRKSTSR